MAINTYLKQHDFRGLVLPVAFVVVWQLASTFGWVNAKLIPAPWSVVETAWQTILSEDFFSGIGASLFRNFSGLFLGGIAGIALGLALGLSRWTERLVGPTFDALRQVSLFAWLPLISTWFGYDNNAKILFISLAAFYPLALNTFEGVRSVSRSHLEVGRVYGLNWNQQITKLVLPAAAPKIFIGLQLALIFAWLATVGSEFLLANWGVGIGNIVIRGREAFNVPLIIFGMLIIGLFGTFFNRVAAHLELRALAWRGPQQ